MRFDPSRHMILRSKHAPSYDYEQHASQWWNQSSGPYRSLHSISPFRLKTIAEWFGPVEGKVIVDAGAGGGILAVPLAQRGATVIALDLSRRSLAQAAPRLNGSGGVCCADCREMPLCDESADYVLLADVLEHVSPIDAVLHEAARILRPHGLVYVNTINRTPLARALAIGLAEGLGLIPRGTQEYRSLVRPEELRRAAHAAGLELVTRRGERPRVAPLVRGLRLELTPSRSFAVAYAALLRKRTA